MSLDTHVSVTIDKEIASLTRAGFGVPLIAAYHTVQPGLRVLTYDAADGLAAMVADGFAITSGAYLAAQSLLSQDPSIERFKIGRRANAPVYTVRLTPKITTQGFIYKFTVDGVEITHTVGAAATVATIIDAIQPLVDALAGVACADNTTHMTITTVATGDLASVVSYHLHSELGVENLTADPGLAADLAAIEAEDAAWYGLLLDSYGAAEILAAAAWAEARNIQFVAQTFDSECKDPSVTDCVLSALEAAAYDRTIPFFHENGLQFIAAAMMGAVFPNDPGSDTWAYKTLSGVTVSPLKATEFNAILNKTGNVYYDVAGEGTTWEGKASSGEYADITRFVDWLQARLQEDIFGELKARKKIPYTNKGANILLNRVIARLQDAEDVGGLADEPKFTAAAKDVALMSTQDRANRIGPDINFGGRLAGAIHKVNLRGKVAV